MRRGLMLLLLLVNLSWCGILPMTADAVVEIVFNPAARTAQKPVLHVPLVDFSLTASTGQPLQSLGSFRFMTYEGMICTRFDGYGGLELTQNCGVFGKGPGTMTLWIYPAQDDGVMHALDVGDLTAGSKVKPLSICVQNGRLAFGGGLLNVVSPVLCTGRWSFIALTSDGQTLTLYCDGKKVEERPLPLLAESSQVRIGGVPGERNSAWHGCLAAVTLYDREVAQAELMTLAGAFHQTTPVPAEMTKEPKSLSYDDLSDKYRRLGISILRKDNRADDDIAGAVLGKDDFKAAAVRVMSCLDNLPESCIKNSGIGTIVILDRLQYKKAPISGITRGDSMYFSRDVDPHTVYHEFFHGFDNQKQSVVWKRFNPDKFTYLDHGNSSVYKSRFTSGKPGGMQKLIDQNRPFAHHFVTAYAMTNEREDRAETFASMVEEGPAFLSRAKQSEVLEQKMQYIIKLTDSSNIMGKDYWPTHLNLQKNAD